MHALSVNQGVLFQFIYGSAADLRLKVQKPVDEDLGIDFVWWMKSMSDCPCLQIWWREAIAFKSQKWQLIGVHKWWCLNAAVLRSWAVRANDQLGSHYLRTQ